MFHYIHTPIMFKHVNFEKAYLNTYVQKLKKNMLILKFHPWIKCLHVFFSFFFVPGWNFTPVFLTGMSSSQVEISSWQQHVNSKRHFIIDRDDFILGRVSSWDEISGVNTPLIKGWVVLISFWEKMTSCTFLVGSGLKDINSN